MSVMAGVTVTPALGGVSVAAIYVGLALVAAIGANLMLRAPQRRAEDGGQRKSVPKGVDPLALRRHSPRAQRLSGLLLIAIAMVLLIALRPVLGGG